MVTSSLVVFLTKFSVVVFS